jgi:hypothetical protein
METLKWPIIDFFQALSTGLLVGGTFLLGALGNLWATRGHHPGWMLMAAAVILIAVALGRSGG